MRVRTEKVNQRPGKEMLPALTFSLMHVSRIVFLLFNKEVAQPSAEICVNRAWRVADKIKSRYYATHY
jgi:hypothetical protein